MSEKDLEQRIQAYLDGEATPIEAGELDRTLAGDEAARERFEELKALFGELAGVRPVAPPEGLADRVIEKVAALPPGARQLYGRATVYARESHDTRGQNPGPETRTPWIDRAGHTTGGNNMSKSFFGNRKALIGTGIAAAAVVFGVYYVQDLPATGEGAAGTIAPAQRYKAAQPTGGDVKLGTPGDSSSASTSATQSSGQVANEAASKATNQATSNAANQAAGQVASEAAAKASNQATNNAANQAAGQAASEAAAKASNQARSNAANQAAGQAASEAAAKASNQARSNAANQAAGQAASEAAAKAANQATNKAANQAAGAAANEAMKK